MTPSPGCGPASSTVSCHLASDVLTDLLRLAFRQPRTEPSCGRSVQVARQAGEGFVDDVTVHPDRMLTARGWAADIDRFRASLTLSIDGEAVAAAHAYRLLRTDVPGPAADGSGFQGAAVEWVLPERECSVTLTTGDDVLAAFDLPAGAAPAYEALRFTGDILHREHIYGSGPPVHEVAPEALALARALPDPILDFGCGAGALVRALRAEGRQAFGLELDEPRIRQHLLPEAAPFVTLYDGRGSAPFAEGQFASVTCCEVLEHMPDPYWAATELVRLAAQVLLVTVPDMSAIPRGFRFGVVPWHLLEATHVNFFTQQSLTALFEPCVASVNIARIGPVRIGDLVFHSSLAATVALRPRS